MGVSSHGAIHDKNAIHAAIHNQNARLRSERNTTSFSCNGGDISHCNTRQKRDITSAFSSVRSPRWRHVVATIALFRRREFCRFIIFRLFCCCCFLDSYLRFKYDTESNKQSIQQASSVLQSGVKPSIVAGHQLITGP